MSSAIVPIVEGHSEVDSLPILLRRVMSLHAVTDISVAKPFRVPKNKIVRSNRVIASEVDKAIKYASKRDGCRAIIWVLDADDDCAKDIGPQLLELAVRAHGDLDIKVVLAVKEFESWFIASVESLRGIRGISQQASAPDNPEDIQGAKEWLSRKVMSGGRTYMATDDQPSLTEAFDLSLARSRSESFDKFMRDVEAIINSLQ